MKWAIVKSLLIVKLWGGVNKDTRADETGNPATDLPNMAMISQGIAIRLSQSSYSASLRVSSFKPP